MYGEIIGASLFFSITLMQADELLKFTNDPLEENIIIVLAFQGVR